jgi:ABC-type phosphate transport system substrate-binding protein
MKRILTAILAMAILLSSPAALAGAPQIPEGDYPIVDGSTATLPLSYALMMDSTGVSEEDAKTAIRHTRTTESFYTLISGDSQLLLVYEPLIDVYDYAVDAGVTLEMKPIGRDALVFLVNDGNPVESLSHEQIIGIYTDKITNWAQTGGDDLDIIAYQRVASSGSQVMMEKQVMQGIEMADAPSSLRPGEMGELVDDIASYIDTPSAIGYSVYFYVNTMYMKENIRLMSVNGIAPTNEAIASGAYPYTQDFYAVIRADSAPDSPERALYDWLGSEDAADLLTRLGYVPVITEEGYNMGYVSANEGE